LGEIGQLRRADEFFREVESDSGDAPARFAFLEAASLRDYTEANAESFENLKEAPGRASNDAPEVRARAAIVEAEVSWTIGKYDEMAASLDQARSAAGEVDDPESRRSLINSSFGWEARALLLGQAKAEDGVDRCDEILTDENVQSSHAAEAAVLAVRAGLQAMLDKLFEARQDYERSRRIGEAFGLAAWLAALPLYSGPVELLARRPADAERLLRRGYITLERTGDKSRRATMAAFLAHALYEQKQDDRAENFARVSKKLAGKDDAYTQVVWRGALAKVLARRDELDQAADFASEAVTLANDTDGLNLKGDAQLDLAEVLRVDDPSEAGARADEARQRYEEKGNQPGVRRAKAFIARLGW
jgi:hypothetical protein